MSRTTSEQDPLVQQAIRWMVLIRSGAADSVEIDAYARWRAADPRHDTACRRLEDTLGVFQIPAEFGANGTLVQRALDTPTTRRRVLQRSLLGAGALLTAGWLGNRVAPVSDVLADLHTATGERRTFRLDDGSDLILNARSAADLYFDARQRRVVLRSGELLARVARDAARPFIVETPAGQVQTLGSEFAVRRVGAASRVVVTQAQVHVATRSNTRLDLAAGQAVHFDRDAFGRIEPAQANETIWVDGFVEARDRPLGEIIDALRPYRTGVLQLDESISAWRVSGLFPLDDSDLALASLGQTLPIRIIRLSALWVRVTPA